MKNSKPNRVPIKELRKQTLEHYKEASAAIKHHNKFVVNCINECVYPDWCGGYIYDKHKFDKDGYCAICGTYVLDCYKKEEFDTDNCDINEDDYRKGFSDGFDKGRNYPKRI